MDAHGTTTDGFQPANKKRKRKRNKKNKGPLPHHIDRSFTNSCRNALNYHSQRARSKTEINCENDPMELWEWNGTKWVAIETNDLGQNAKQVIVLDRTIVTTLLFDVNIYSSLVLQKPKANAVNHKSKILLKRMFLRQRKYVTLNHKQHRQAKHVTMANQERMFNCRIK